MDAERFGGSVDGTGYRFGFSRVDFFLEIGREKKWKCVTKFNIYSITLGRICGTTVECNKLALHKCWDRALNESV